MEPMWAIIFKPWNDDPIYHALRPFSRFSTRCGRRVGDNTPGLPMKHVKKFGRPCKGCFNA